MKTDLNKNVIFLTYDGLLDPLGGSQILPYLIGISKHTSAVHILSFEKAHRINEKGDSLAMDLNKLNISWTPLIFSSKFGIFGKILDLIKFFIFSFYICVKNKINIIHARGLPSALIGGLPKLLLNTSLIFDFRGLWVDERVDKGGWDLKRYTHRLQYSLFKKLEKVLLSISDEVIVLTNKVVDEVCRLGKISPSKVTVIPCCADYDFFKLPDSSQVSEIRKRLNIPQDSIVIGYLGSAGGMYITRSYIELLNSFGKLSKDFIALVITPDKEKFQILINEHLDSGLRQKVIIHSANRKDVPSYLAVFNYIVNFTFPSYARLSMSPTKLAECFATGIPMICNSGVGDVDENVKTLDGGLVIPDVTQNSLLIAANYILTNRHQSSEELRASSRSIFGLEVARKRYQDVYSKL
jgi:glycosyltransferase involved in cell wall biosynthesis